jgi:hypothetical protein
MADRGLHAFGNTRRRRLKPRESVNVYMTA